MNLQIRDPRARELARKLADARNVSITEAVVDALKAELERAMDTAQLADTLALDAEPKRSRAELVEQLHKYHGLIGSDIKFDRDEANAR